MFKILALCFFCVSILFSKSYSQDTISSGQDTIKEKQMELLSNINSELSNCWTINLNLNDSTEESYKANAVKSYLFTYKTKKDGRNSGVVMNLYDIKFKDTVLIAKKRMHSSMEVMFLYTESYIVYINYGKNVNSIYDSYLPLLVDELKLFFDKNKAKL